MRRLIDDIINLERLTRKKAITFECAGKDLARYSPFSLQVNKVGILGEKLKGSGSHGPNL
jgi:hypothetical protein